MNEISINDTNTKGDKSTCWYCGQKGVMTKDHFFPKSQGGVLKVYCCEDCNRLKADLTPEEWIYKIRYSSLPLQKKSRIIRATESLLIRIRIPGINMFKDINNIYTAVEVDSMVKALEIQSKIEFSELIKKGSKYIILIGNSKK